VVVENQRLITEVYFRRLILPISETLSGLVDFALGFMMLIGFTVAHGIRPTLAALWLPPLNHDVKYVIPFLVQFWMYFDGKRWPEKSVVEHGFSGSQPCRCSSREDGSG
jgi:ABC-type polysaccharide/polyol phosphate export permease